MFIKKLALVFTAVIVMTCTVAAQDQPQDQNQKVIQHANIQPTSPASGKEMYNTYCAVCHGADGKGGGPAASALKTQPTNLAQLAKENGGKFPDAHIYSVLQFGMETPAHGSQDMPIWGPAFRSLDRGVP